MEAVAVDEVSSKEERKFVFKDRMFSYYLKVSNKKKIWKSLKQVISQERNLPWPKDTIHYSSIVAPPSFKPAKKYSDVSGLPAKYIDPQTKLYYSNADEFCTCTGTDDHFEKEPWNFVRNNNMHYHEYHEEFPEKYYAKEISPKLR